MSARIGAVSFNSQTGHSEVTSEAALKAELDWRELNDSQELTDANRSYGQCLELIRVSELSQLPAAQANRERVAAKRMLAISEGLKTGKRAPQSQVEATVQRYYKMKVRYDELKQAKEEDKTKYGKIIYYYEEKTLYIYRKYPVMDELYSGPLL